MPFYEYQCKSCGHHLEAMQKVNDPPLKKCPQCGKSQLVKLISAPVFRLKGSGWYETDFKSDQEGKRNLAVEKDEAPAATEKKEDKKDAGTDKPAEKAADKPASKDAASGEKASKSAAKPAARAAAKPKPTARRKPAPAKKSRRR